MAGKQTVRLSYDDLQRMIDILNKTTLVEDKSKMNILVSYESVGGIGANLTMTVENAIVMDQKANVEFELVGVKDW